ncbi:MAG: Eco57I restriction-modification methylase domain-containing protein [Phycisphaerae bacterium]
MQGDYTQQTQVFGKRFNLVLTNPPYVRHHHLSPKDKRRLQARIAEELGLSISGLAGLYVHFLLLTHQWMEEGGIGIWLIPSEFTNVNYGIAVQRYLTEHVRLLHMGVYVLVCKLM